MENLKASAIINIKENPNQLMVNGTVITYYDDDKLIVSKSNPQGINPTILLLYVKIYKGSGPMKGTQKQFIYLSNDTKINSYKKVCIITQTGLSLTVDIEMFA